MTGLEYVLVYKNECDVYKVFYICRKVTQQQHKGKKNIEINKVEREKEKVLKERGKVLRGRETDCVGDSKCRRGQSCPQKDTEYCDILSCVEG